MFYDRSHVPKHINIDIFAQRGFVMCFLRRFTPKCSFVDACSTLFHDSQLSWFATVMTRNYDVSQLCRFAATMIRNDHDSQAWYAIAIRNRISHSRSAITISYHYLFLNKTENQHEKHTKTNTHKNNMTKYNPTNKKRGHWPPRPMIAYRDSLSL